LNWILKKMKWFNWLELRKISHFNCPGLIGGKFLVLSPKLAYRWLDKWFIGWTFSGFHDDLSRHLRSQEIFRIEIRAANDIPD
jgi:hypothetical protein